MILDNTYIKINGTSIGKYLTEAVFNFPKLWGDGTGRSLSGTFNGTFIGIFPKIELTFKPMTQSELQTIVQLIDTAFQDFTYYDPFKAQLITIRTYAGDYNYTIDNTTHTSTLKVSFISVSKRS